MLKRVEAVVATARRVNEQRPAAILHDDGPDVVPRLWVSQRPFGEHHADRVGTYKAVVVVGACHLPNRAVNGLDEHLLPVLALAHLGWQKLVDDAPTLAVNAVPDGSTRLGLLGEQMPIGADALEHVAGGEVQRAAILASTAMPDSAAALEPLAMTKAVEQIALVRTRRPVIRYRQRQSYLPM